MKPVFVEQRVLQESADMPKLKTHKGLAKRIKVTKKGKLRRMQAFHRHLMTGKGGARRRRGKRSRILVGAEAKRVGRLLGLR
jgi:large subunit ribosomal protein L35